jgi:hypothetical protein
MATLSSALPSKIVPLLLGPLLQCGLSLALAASAAGKREGASAAWLRCFRFAVVPGYRTPANVEGIGMTKKLVEDGSSESPLPGVKIIPPEEVKRFVVTQAPKRASLARNRVEPVEKYAVSGSGKGASVKE